MYYMYVLVYSLLHICDSMAGHWTTSPPCLQVVAPGHKEHEELATIGWRITAHWVQSSGQNYMMQHEVLTQRACQQVMMLSTMRNWWSSSFFYSTLWWMGEAVISIHRDYFRPGDYALYLCTIQQISLLIRSFYHLWKQFVT